MIETVVVGDECEIGLSTSVRWIGGVASSFKALAGPIFPYFY